MIWPFADKAGIYPAAGFADRLAAQANNPYCFTLIRNLLFRSPRFNIELMFYSSGAVTGPSPNGVIVRRDCADNLRLLAHEFVHVAHYERLGREGFLQEYIQQIAANGYLNAPFEQEAEAKATNRRTRVDYRAGLYR